jgi:hypothetical protein
VLSPFRYSFTGDRNRAATYNRRDRNQKPRLVLADDQGPTTDDWFSGGADRDRTGGLLVANQALSQLSYSPIFSY